MDSVAPLEVFLCVNISCRHDDDGLMIAFLGHGGEKNYSCGYFSWRLEVGMVVDACFEYGGV